MDHSTAKIYASYYSKLHSMLLDGEVESRKGNRAVFRPFRKTVGKIVVPPRMLQHIVMVDDAGTVKDMREELNVPFTK